MEMSSQLHAPAGLPLGETAAGTRYVGGWVGPRAGLEIMDERKNSCPYPESCPNFSVAQPFA
jgi:hypothetical protein